MTRGSRFGPWPLVLAAMFVLAFSAAARAQEDCAACHEDVVKAFAKTTHGRGFEAQEGASCSSCHGSGQAHVEASGEGPIGSPAKGRAGEANQACLTCHQGNPKQAHWQGSVHEAAGLKCASCHDVHGARAGTPAEPRPLSGVSAKSAKCLTCHGAVRANLSQRSSHPLRTGQMECASCHNPHGATGDKLIDRASVNDLCYTCHQELRGPFLWEHSPVREDCTTCHKAHGSNYPSMLVARVTQLCQSCHQQGRHQTIAALPASMWVSNRACLNCHSQIHGSNHPSGPLFHR